MLNSAIASRFFPGCNCGAPGPIQVGGEAVIVAHLENQRFGPEWLLQYELARKQNDRGADRQLLIETQQVLVLPISIGFDQYHFKRNGRG